MLDCRNFRKSTTAFPQHPHNSNFNNPSKFSSNPSSGQSSEPVLNYLTEVF